MTEINDKVPVDRNDPAARVAEITRLFLSIRNLLDVTVQAIGDPDTQTPKAVLSKLSELQSAHLKVLTAEEAFHESCEQVADHEDIDLDAVRAEIGCQLDRIRATIVAGEIP